MIPPNFVRAVAACALLFCPALVDAQGGGPFDAAQGARGQRPARDPSARPAPPAGTGIIGGRVLAADSGRPMKRARVLVQSTQSGGRAAITDAEGRFEVRELPAGRYTVTASKTGFVSVSFGQRRPLQASTPIDLRDGQELKAIELRLPRGSVITGHVFDEDGEPIAQGSVRVMRWAFQQGERRLTPAGNDQTDDRGEYRVFGLPPGQYVVSAVARNADFPGIVRQMVTAAVREQVTGGGGRGAALAALAGPADDEEAIAFAPTYYPGVITIADAGAVSVTLAQEVSGIDFALQLVRMAAVSGTVASPAGAIGSASVMLVPEVPGAGAALNASARVRDDGTFRITSVPPGRYTLVARSNPVPVGGRGGRGAAAGAVPQQFAVQPIAVSGQDLEGVTLVLGGGASIAGTISFENGQMSNATQVRVSAPMVGSVQLPVRNATARVEPDGTFVLDGVPAGLHLLRATAPGGWWLKSAQLYGRDVIDTPIEIKDGQQVRGVTLVFSNLVTTISGTVTDARNQPVSGVNVVAFPADQAQWTPQTRRIQTARPDQNGHYQMRGLPPGDYLIAAVDGAEQGEWFDPTFLAAIRAHATRLMLADGETKTQDLKPFTVEQ